MTLGETLKNKRNELARSIEQMAALTRIHAKTLKALEEDQYELLPARAFTRGFIVSYAKALRLNADDLIKSHSDFLEKKFSERPDRDQGHQGYAFEGKELEQNRRWMIIAASVAAFFAIIVLIFFKPQNHKNKEKHKEFVQQGATGLPVQSPAQNSPIPNLSPAASTAPTTIPTIAHTVVTSTPTPAPTVQATATTVAPMATPKPSASPSPIPATSTTADAKTDPMDKGDHLVPGEAKKRILLEALEDTWVRYRSDDKPARLIILRKGKFLVVKGMTSVEVESSKPDALRYKNRQAVYVPVPANAVQVGDKNEPKPLNDGIQNAPAFPSQIPVSPQENR